jgi:hypothetical protein
MSEHDALANWVHMEVMRVLHRTTRRTPVQVDGYDDKTHAVKLKLMPDSMDGSDPVITGWVPLPTPQGGNGFGWHMPPNINDHGWVEFHDSDREAGQYVGGVFNDKFKPIAGVKAGEWLYKNAWGTLINFKADGSATVADKNGASITFDGQGTTTITGKDGSQVVLDKGGKITVKPKDGSMVFLGGDGATGSYDFVMTSTGPSTNVKARIG